MVSFSFRKFIKCVESHYATCETYSDSGTIEQRGGVERQEPWNINFRTEFDRHGLFRFEWRDQKNVLTKHFPNAENVVWANKYGAFGRFDFEENTHNFLDLAQALEACCSISSGVAPMTAAMLYPELRAFFDRPASLKRPSLVKIYQCKGRQLLSVVWQSADDGLVSSRQVLFDVASYAVLEVLDVTRKLTLRPVEEGAADDLTRDLPQVGTGGVLGQYLSPAGTNVAGAQGQRGEIVSLTKVIFDNVRITPSGLAAPVGRAD